MPTKALIFDFDGLILDTEGPVYQAWQELYDRLGCKLSFDAWAGFIGTSENDVFDPLSDLEIQLGRKVEQADLDVLRRRERALIASLPVLPGVETYLYEARRMHLKIGLASSSSCAWVNGHLERLRLRSYFDCVRASDDVLRTKPDPEVYLAALACLEIPAKQALVFEDSPNGIQAAQQAGIFAVAVPNPITRRLDLSHADLIIESMAAISLVELLQKVEALRQPAA